MHLHAASSHIEQSQIPSFAALPLPAFHDLRTYLLAAICTVTQAGEVNAPAARAAAPTGSSEKLIPSPAAEEKNQTRAVLEDRLEGAVELSKIPAGESVLGRPIMIAKVKLRIDLEETVVRIFVEGMEFYSHESLISLEGTEVVRNETGGVRICHPHLGTFRVNRWQLDVLARRFRRARTGECTLTIPVTYVPEQGMVAVGKKMQTVKHSMTQLFSAKPLPPPSDPSVFLMFERLSLSQ